MIEFMLIAAPRCGTTWAANWMTTDTTMCLHDPLYKHHYTELDDIKSGKVLGVSCTGLYNFPSWVNSHPARKVILHRPLHEINDSMAAIGLPTIHGNDLGRLDQIQGLHLDWRAMFDEPRLMYEYLTQKEFDAERHAELKDIEMQPNFVGLSVGKEVTKRLIEELRSI